MRKTMKKTMKKILGKLARLAILAGKD